MSNLDVRIGDTVEYVGSGDKNAIGKSYRKHISTVIDMHKRRGVLEIKIQYSDGEVWVIADTGYFSVIPQSLENE